MKKLRAAKRRRKKKDERGVALIVVLGAIAVLTVLLADFQDETSAELAAALAERDALKAEYLARSGLSLSRLLLAAEPTIRQSLAIFFLGQKSPPQIPIWEFSDKILAAFNDKESSPDFFSLTGSDPSTGKNLGITGGSFKTVVVDEDSKIDVNLASRGDPITQSRLAMQLSSLMFGEQYNPMFESRDQDGQFTDRQVLCGALVDWADPDENLYPCDLTATAPQTAATEDSFYQMLKRPYRRKNAAYDSLEELHMVRGVSDDFWATFVDPDPDNPKKRVMTVWSQGAVNVNTANAQTLLAIILGGSKQVRATWDVTDVSKFLTIVGLIRSFTAGAPLFSSPTDFVRTMKGQGTFGPLLAAIGIKPVVWDSDAETQKMISTESKMFSIYADGVVPGFQRKTRVRLHAVVDFRGAPPPGMVPFGGAGSGAAAFGAPPGSPTAGGQLGAGKMMPPGGVLGAGAMAGGGQLPPGLPAGATPDGIPGALVPNPAGTIVYWRME